MQDAKDKTIKELARDCRTVDDVHILLRDLFRDTLQTMPVTIGFARQKGCQNGSQRSRKRGPAEWSFSFCAWSIGAIFCTVSQSVLQNVM